MVASAQQCTAQQLTLIVSAATCNAEVLAKATVAISPMGQPRHETLSWVERGPLWLTSGVPAQRNYRFFLSFVFLATLLCAWVFALSLVQLFKYRNDAHVSFGRAIGKHPASLVTMIYTFLAFWCGTGCNCVILGVVVEPCEHAPPNPTWRCMGCSKAH